MISQKVFYKPKKKNLTIKHIPASLLRFLHPLQLLAVNLLLNDQLFHVQHFSTNTSSPTIIASLTTSGTTSSAASLLLLLLLLLSSQRHLCRHNPLTLHHEQTALAATLAPPAQLFVPSEAGNYAVIAATGTFGRPQVLGFLICHFFL